QWIAGRSHAEWYRLPTFDARRARLNDGPRGRHRNEPARFKFRNRFCPPGAQTPVHRSPRGQSELRPLQVIFQRRGWRWARRRPRKVPLPSDKWNDSPAGTRRAPVLHLRFLDARQDFAAKFAPLPQRVARSRGSPPRLLQPHCPGCGRSTKKTTRLPSAGVEVSSSTSCCSGFETDPCRNREHSAIKSPSTEVVSAERRLNDRKATALMINPRLQRRSGRNLSDIQPVSGASNPMARGVGATRNPACNGS